MKLLSLFDGSGGFPLAGAMCGIIPVAASEVEPFPIRVTTKRFPDMKHLGDISKINGAEIEPVDVITFGSPCQDLSVAGKRKGLNHSELGDEETTRSGLFMEAVRIIREMKEATNGEYPTFAVWENVPGAYSSNKGEDFRIVLEELEKTACNGADIVPKPPKGKWLNAGEIVGDNYSIAWRTLDAQFCGVPQRRRRIYLVADFRGKRAGKILFEREGLRGDFTQSRTPWQGTAGNAENGIGAADRESKGIINLNKHDVQSKAILDPEGICPCLYAGESRYGGGEVYVLDMPQADRGRMGTGGGNVPLVMEKSAGFKPGQGVKAHGMGYEEECSPTLLAGQEPGVVICLQGNGIDRADTAGCNGKGWKEDTSYTPHYIVRRLTPLECCRLQGFPDWWCSNLETDNPTESDIEFWREVFETHRTVISGTSKPKTDKQIIKWLKDPYGDSAIYKMWGNGIALPNALFVMQGIAEELCREVRENELLQRMENV